MANFNKGTSLSTDSALSEDIQENNIFSTGDRVIFYEPNKGRQTWGIIKDFVLNMPYKTCKKKQSKNRIAFFICFNDRKLNMFCPTLKLFFCKRKGEICTSANFSMW